MATKLRRFPRIPGARTVGKKPRPRIQGADPKIAERDSDALQRLTRDLGGTSQDAKLAKRVMQLKQEYPIGSYIELVTHEWLTVQNIPFDYQAVLFGGRREKGGILPDFVVQASGGYVAWLINGEYWHSQSVNQGRDEIARLKLLGAQHKGKTITNMVSLWEKDILRKRPIVFQQALLGVGLRD